MPVFTITALSIGSSYWPLRLSWIPFWRLSESIVFFGSTPLDPAGSQVTNHADQSYVLIITSLILTFLTALALSILAARNDPGHNMIKNYLQKDEK
ncbi:MAG: hypothetical protein NTW32_09520 [Chloroflexi bacterium]|nr:hypothetical protein [Chloroflexota bacterium]